MVTGKCNKKPPTTKKPKKLSRRCTQPMEMIVQMQTVEEIPDNLLVTFVLQETPAIIHCYNIVDLRGWILAGNDSDVLTKIKFTPAQMKTVERQWDKLRSKKSKDFIDVLMEDEIISSSTAEIPSWDGKGNGKDKGKKPDYDIVVSASTPYPYMVAVHIMDVGSKAKIPESVISNGSHHQWQVWDYIKNLSKWTLLLPSPGYDPVNVGAHYRAVDGGDKEIDSSSDSAAILGDIIKAWGENKLLTKSKFVNGLRSGSDKTWKLNLPNLISEISDKYGYLSGLIPWLKQNGSYDVLETGGDILPNELWNYLRGGGAADNRQPDPDFYQLWELVVEQIHYLIYNESSQY